MRFALELALICLFIHREAMKQRFGAEGHGKDAGLIRFDCDKTNMKSHSEESRHYIGVLMPKVRGLKIFEPHVSEDSAIDVLEHC